MKAKSAKPEFKVQKPKVRRKTEEAILNHEELEDHEESKEGGEGDIYTTFAP